MRYVLFASALALTSIGQAQQFYTQAFVRQEFHSQEWKTIERYGRAESEIVKMGHDRFVAWYCDEARAGKEGRVQAEKVFGLAYNECSAPILLRLPRSEQKFMEDAMTAFGDMAKSSVSCAVLSFGEDRPWSLVYAQSSTAVTETVYALLNPRFTPPAAIRPTDLDAICTTVTQRVRARRPDVEGDGGRLKFLDGHIQKIFKDRSPREKALAKAFALKAAQLALVNPE